MIKFGGGLARLLETVGIEFARQVILADYRFYFAFVSSCFAEHLNDYAARQIFFCRPGKYFDYNLVFFFGSFSADVVNRDRLEKTSPVRLNNPSFRVFQQRSDKPILCPFKDLDYFAGIAHLTAALAFSFNLYNNDVTGHCIGCRIWRNK
ncbi:hypothetical protein ES703_107793 [subsurface metagenome]